MPSRADSLLLYDLLSIALGQQLVSSLVYHTWAVRIFEKESPPFYTAEPILAEVAAVLGTADDVLQMVEVGDLVLGLNLGDEVFPVRALVQKYKDHPMDLGDACCVRLAEL